MKQNKPISEILVRASRKQATRTDSSIVNVFSNYCQNVAKWLLQAQMQASTKDSQ